MKVIFCIVVLIGIAHLYEYNLNHDSNYKVGNCVGGGWNYCLKTASWGASYLDYERYSTSNSDPERRCESCNDCDANTWGDWACTTLYANDYYSFMVNVYKTDKCGSEFYDPIELSATGDAADAAVTASPSSLDSGDACFYIMENACGGGSFSVADATGMLFYVLESDETSVDYSVDPSSGEGDSSTNSNRQAGAPWEGPSVYAWAC